MLSGSRWRSAGRGHLRGDVRGDLCAGQRLLRAVPRRPHRLRVRCTSTSPRICGTASWFEQASLAATTERHHIELAAPALEAIADPLDELRRRTADGAVFALSTGIPNRSQLDAIAHVLRSGTRAWIYFPAEQAIECVDEERLESLHRHLTMVRWLKRIGGPLDRLVARVHRAERRPALDLSRGISVRRSDEAAALDRLIIRAQPVAPASCEAGRDRIAGSRHALLQSDFWNTSSGGGTTADVASAARGDDPIVWSA